MANKVVRITRHDADETQMNELVRIYGSDVEVVTVKETMPSDSHEFTVRFDELAEGATVVEAVLPPNLIEVALKFTQLCKDGGQIIRSVMDRVPRVDEDGNSVLNDRNEQVMDFIFDHYERVIKVEIVTEVL